MGKLIIIFVIGLGIAGIPFLLLSSGVMGFHPDMILLIIPIGIGAALMMIAGTKALKKADRYLDK